MSPRALWSARGVWVRPPVWHTRGAACLVVPRASELLLTVPGVSVAPQEQQGCASTGD